MEKEKCKNITTVKKNNIWRDGNDSYGCRNRKGAVYSTCE